MGVLIQLNNEKNELGVASTCLGHGEYNRKQDSWVLMDLPLTTTLVLGKLDSITEPYARDIYPNVYHVFRAILNAGTTLANKVDTIHVPNNLTV